jgi:ankyrin repeat protein
MRRLYLPSAFLAFSLLACGQPDAPPLPTAPDARDKGFPISARQPCTEDARAALRSVDPIAVANAAAHGVKFTCGEVDDEMAYPLPLDRAILDDRTDRVRALLAAGADPNARWYYRGDHHPLQETVECSYYKTDGSARCRYGAEMVRLLLRAGANPNAGWCPFRSRPERCTTANPVTPLMAAAESAQADVVALLLAAGANPHLEDAAGGSALAHAFTGPTFQLLATAMFPDPKTRDANALRHLTEKGDSVWLNGPWNSTALGKAIVGRGPTLLPPPPPPPVGTPWPAPPPPSAQPSYAYINVLLDIGANPNERVSTVGNSPPIALAVGQRSSGAIAALLGRGADPNLRWCMPVPQLGQRWEGVAPSGCALETGTTPLMLAAALGSEDIASLLMQAGARADLRDWQGRTALDHAPASARVGMVKTLTAQPAAVERSR